MFRKLTTDSPQIQYGSILSRNIELLGRINFSLSLKRKFALFLSIFPLPDEDYHTYQKLDKYKKAGFLCSYLIKTCKEKGMDDIFIREYLKMRKNFKQLQLDYKTKNKESELERIKNYLQKKQYSSILSIYQNESHFDYEKKKMENYTKMLLMFCNNDFIKEYRKNRKDSPPHRSTTSPWLSASRPSRGLEVPPTEMDIDEPDIEVAVPSPSRVRRSRPLR